MYLNDVWKINQSCLFSATSVWMDICSTSLVIACRKFDTTAAASTSSSSNWIRHNYLVIWLSLNTHFNHLNECFIDALSFFSWGLKIKHIIIFLAPRLCFLSSDFSLTLSINFISNQNEWECFWIIWSCIFNKAGLPVIKCVETSRISKIETKCTAISSSVECKPKGLEFLLSSCIPNLKSNNLAINLNFLLWKVCSDSWFGIGTSLIMNILLEECCLTDTWISQDNNF